MRARYYQFSRERENLCNAGAIHLSFKINWYNDGNYVIVELLHKKDFCFFVIEALNTTN